MPVNLKDEILAGEGYEFESCEVGKVSLSSLHSQKVGENFAESAISVTSRCLAQ